jgi:hypothetical protein
MISRLSWQSPWPRTVLPDESNPRDVRPRLRNTVRKRSSVPPGAAAWRTSPYPVRNARSSSLGKTAMVTIGARFLVVGLQSQVANGEHCIKDEVFSRNSRSFSSFILLPTSFPCPPTYSGLLTRCIQLGLNRSNTSPTRQRGESGRWSPRWRVGLAWPVCNTSVNRCRLSRTPAATDPTARVRNCQMGRRFVPHPPGTAGTKGPAGACPVDSAPRPNRLQKWSLRCQTHARPTGEPPREKWHKMALGSRFFEWLSCQLEVHASHPKHVLLVVYDV